MSVQALINDLRVSRQNFVNVLNAVPKENWTKVPVGFNNHLFWNLSHVVVTQQLLIYRLSSLDAHVGEELIERYRKGSMPPSQVSEEEVAEVLRLAISTVDQLQKDWEAGLFKEVDFKEYPTSFGVTLRSVEDAIRFNNMHDALHLGYAMSMRRALA